MRRIQASLFRFRWFRRFCGGRWIRVQGRALRAVRNTVNYVGWSKGWIPVRSSVEAMMLVAMYDAEFEDYR